MRVTRIEIFGFKSFMEKTVLPLEGGVTSVVGPNGCGKSNIVDALRWVLGETRASNLRGGVLEDVIFNGTDKLRPLGLAEVTITLRASEANFFADLVSPSLEADLVAELANLDLDTSEAEQAGVELAKQKEATDGDSNPGASETSEGRPQLTVISGGLDESAELEVEQNQLAEASSESLSSPLGQDQAPAVERSATLLTRFSWLKAVSEVQITRRLYRSGESEFFINRVACRLKDLKDFFRAIGLGARSHTIVAQGEVSRIVTAKPEERRLILEDAAGVLGFRDKIASAGRRLEETGVNISRLDDVIKEVDRQVSSLKRQASRAESRQELKQRIAELDDALFLDKAVEIQQQESVAQSKIQQVRDAESKASSELVAAQAQEQEARNDLMSIDVESDTLRAKMDGISEEIYQRERQRSDRRSRIAEIGAFILARGTEMRRLEDRQTTLQQRKASAGTEISNLEVREQVLTKEIGEFETGGEDELRGAADTVTQSREALKNSETELRSVREEFISSQSSLRAVKEQLIAASPVTQLKDSLASKASQFLNQVAEGTRLLVDGLTVPAEYSKCTQAVLAERAQFLVTDKPYSIARQFVEEAYGSGERKKRLGLGVLKQGDAELLEMVGVTPPFKRLLDLITVAPGFQLAATRLLRDVFVAESLAEASAFFEERGSVPGVTLVTLDGDIVTDYSFFSLRHEGGIIQLKIRAAQLESSVNELEAKQAECHKAKEEAQRALREAEAFQAEALRRSRERQAKVRDLVNQRGTVIGRLHSERRTLEQVDSDLVKAQQQVKDCEVKIAEYKTEEVRLNEELKTLVSDTEQELKAELEVLQKQYAEFDKTRRGGREKLAQFALAAQEARSATDRARSEVSNITLTLQKLSLEKANLQERFSSEFEAAGFESLLARAQQVAPLDPKVKSEFAEELSRLKQRIIREGDVDPTSIERYSEEKVRLDGLNSQRTDLNQAAETLKRTIEKLTETSEKRFLSTFKAVRENFIALVPRLFGGGKGDLELLDPSKPLDSGVEIVARPPGKKLKSIELMSGGEKCMCATALILGMFMEKPSPLCVLDEVDAPLDEANLVRFLTLIKEMSKRTQFLIITHNKNTMATADNLVGVTMQEPGATKLISVSLQEAFSQVA